MTRLIKENSSLYYAGNKYAMNTRSDSIEHYAKTYLGCKTLPAKIRDALHNILTKGETKYGEKCKPPPNTAFRESIKESESNNHNERHFVLPGKQNAIFNILCLWHLVGVTKTKEILHKRHLDELKEKDMEVLNNVVDEHYLQFFCLGIVRSDIEKISNQLQDSKFDIYTQKLTSPFSTNKLDNNDRYGIGSILHFADKSIPWREYMDKYQKAESLFLGKKLDEAKMCLKELSALSMIRLPIIDTLLKKIEADEHENKEAFDYLQQILK